MYFQFSMISVNIELKYIFPSFKTLELCVQGVEQASIEWEDRLEL